VTSISTKQCAAEVWSMVQAETHSNCRKHGILISFVVVLNGKMWARVLLTAVDREILRRMDANKSEETEIHPINSVVVTPTFLRCSHFGVCLLEATKSFTKMKISYSIKPSHSQTSLKPVTSEWYHIMASNKRHQKGKLCQIQNKFTRHLQQNSNA
jgi:hypothetical protein